MGICINNLQMYLYMQSQKLNRLNIGVNVRPLMEILMEI